MINERIIVIREMLNLSQRELAEELHISKSTYARWETGEKIIPLTHLVDLCNYANRSIDYALGLIDDRLATNDIITIDKTSIGIKLKNLRIENHESQDDIAKDLNVTQSVVSEYENGIILIQTAFYISFVKDIKYQLKLSYHKRLLISLFFMPKYIPNQIITYLCLLWGKKIK